jgi:hypothetical protein
MSLSYWDGEMMRDNKRWIIRLEFDRRKNIQTIIIQVESNYEPKRSWLKLSSFNDRAKIARIKLTQVKLAGVTVISSYPFDPKLPFVKRLMVLPHKRVLVFWYRYLYHILQLTSLMTQFKSFNFLFLDCLI